MSDYVEWNPKRHGQKPPYWEPGMPTSVDGLNFSHQPNWAWIAGSTYYVPREAVELPRIEPDPEQTDNLIKRLRDWGPAEGPPEGRTAPDAVADMREAADRIEALTAELKAALDREAVELPRIEPDPEQTDEQRIRTQVIQEIREAVEREAMSDVYNCTIGGGAAQALRIIYAALEKQP
jgi:hypothetical protein